MSQSTSSQSFGEKMSRYPSSGVERFDQQFAEAKSDRSERLRRKRAPTTMSDLDRLHAKENEIARLMTALTRILGALKPADIAANVETVGKAREIACAALAGETTPGLDEYDHYANEDHMGQGG
jgi:hypothetical protein